MPQNSIKGDNRLEQTAPFELIKPSLTMKGWGERGELNRANLILAKQILTPIENEFELSKLKGLRGKQHFI